MAIIHLHEKYEKRILSQYTHESFVAGTVSKEYDFQGVKGIHITTPVTVPLTDYKAEGLNRFGETVEMGDRVQYLVMRQNKSFSVSLDNTNQSDQQYIKQAGQMMKLQQAEQVVPTIDKYALGEFANNAGQIKAVANPTKSNIVNQLFDMETAFTNALIPLGDRFLFIGGTVYNHVRMSPEFLGVDVLAKEDLTRGVVGMIAGFKAVVVPDSYMPANAHYLGYHRRSVIQPTKINMARINTKPQGIDGALLEGHYYFDAFVLGERANGVYVATDASKKTANPTIAIVSNEATITGTGVVMYTIDGSDPRYSKDAKVYTAKVKSLAKGAVVKAVAKENDKFASDVVTQVNP
jgi:hypothetical protein